MRNRASPLLFPFFSCHNKEETGGKGKKNPNLPVLPPGLSVVHNYSGTEGQRGVNLSRNKARQSLIHSHQICLGDPTTIQMKSSI